MPVEVTPTGSLGLDLALGVGGIPKGEKKAYIAVSAQNYVELAKEYKYGLETGE